MPLRKIYITAVFTLQFATDIQKDIFFTIQKKTN